MIPGLSRTAHRIEDWRERGLIDAETARTLLADLEAKGADRSFSTIAIWLGVVCVAFGAMTFVAANWDAMPRIVRMSVLLGGMLVSYIIAGLFYKRGRATAAEAFILLGCAVFGAAVMFTGQMYHLSGPPSGGVLLWTCGTVIAALVTGSRNVLGFAVILAALWTIMSMAISGVPFHLWFVPVWLGFSVMAWIWRARGVAHLCALAAMAWLITSVVIHTESADIFTTGYVTIMASLAAISLIIYSASGPHILRDFEGDTVLYLVALVYAMLGLLYIAREALSLEPTGAAVIGVAIILAVVALLPLVARRAWLDHMLAALWIGVSLLLARMTGFEIPYAVEAFALAISVWTIRMGGRQGWRKVTTLGIAGFVVTMLIIYAAAAHGLLGTSLFYLIAGALLLLGALVVPKLIAVRENAR